MANDIIKMYVPSDEKFEKASKTINDGILNDAILKNDKEKTDTLKIKLFWAIEHKDIDGLQKVIDEIKINNIQIGMYFPTTSWQKIFTKEEAKNIKVYICGLMDFNPIQHVCDCDVDWLEGAKILVKNNVGIDDQGCGLRTVLIDKLLEYCEEIIR